MARALTPPTTAFPKLPPPSVGKNPSPTSSNSSLETLRDKALPIALERIGQLMTDQWPDAWAAFEKALKQYLATHAGDVSKFSFSLPLRLKFRRLKGDVAISPSVRITVSKTVEGDEATVVNVQPELEHASNPQEDKK